MTPADEAPTEGGAGPADDQAPERGAGPKPPKAPAAKKAAPKKGRGPGRPKAAATLGKEAGEAIGDAAALTYLGALAAGQERLAYDAQIIATNAEGIGLAIGKACDKSPAMYRAVQGLLTTSAYAELLGVLLAVGVPIAVNHGLIPERFWGTLPGTSGVDPPPARPPREPFHPDDPEADARAAAAFDSLRDA